MGVEIAALSSFFGLTGAFALIGTVIIVIAIAAAARNVVGRRQDIRGVRASVPSMDSITL